ncbi:MAG: DUF2726 domain-containing protein [Bacillota bacterium]
MELLLGVIVVALMIYFVIDKFILKKNDEDVKVPENNKLPYKISDNFLTDTECSFYHSLKLYLGEKAIICPKVGLKDIFFIGKGVGKDYMKYFNKIAKKHVDFLLCDPSTMKPLCGIELDDISHTNKKSYNRDLFIEKVYKDANFKLIRISSKSGYTHIEIETALTDVLNRSQEIPIIQNDDETVLCPKCSIPMVLRKAAKGQNAGKEFYGCVNYPNCKEVINKGV